MSGENNIEKSLLEIEKGLRLEKCKKCGCMKDAIDCLGQILQVSNERFRQGREKMKPIEYTCLGCNYCFAAAAMNFLPEAFCPPAAGEYHVLGGGVSRPVAVSTLASVGLAETLADAKPECLCLVGKTETENIGVEKLVKNTITKPDLRFLMVAGRDPDGHQSGKTLMALSKDGVDKDMKVIGSPGRRPILKNLAPSEVDAFRKQVRIVDMIGCEDPEAIMKKIKELAINTSATCGCGHCSETVPAIEARRPEKHKMDKKGYFVIIPSRDKNAITVEHFAYDNKLLHVIRGRDARSIYSTIIKRGFVSELDHAAYLGSELAKAEISVEHEFKYTQDKALEGRMGNEK
jgi:tetrahydromethanopterin S-methyltransferase subunit A